MADNVCGFKNYAFNKVYDNVSYLYNVICMPVLIA